MQELIKPIIGVEREVVKQEVVPNQEVFDSKIAAVETKLQDDKRDKQTDKVIKQEDKKFKQTDKLIKAVVDLDKRLKGDGKGTDKDGKKTGILNFIKSGIKEKVSNAFSLKGLAGMTGLAGMGTLGALAAGGIDERDAAMKDAKAKKSEEKTAADEGARLIGKYTTGGKAAAALPDGGKAHNEEQYKIKTKYNDEIDEIEKEQAEAKSVGGGASVGKDKEDRLKQLKIERDTQFDGMPKVDPAPVPKKNRVPLVTSSVEAPVVANSVGGANNPIKEKPGTEPIVAPVDPLAKVRAQVEKRGDPLEQALLAKYDKQQAEKAASSVEAPMVASSVEAPPVDSDNNPIKESEDIQLKQLAALETLVANSVTSEEDRLESKKPETNTVIKEQKKPEEKSGGLIDSLLGAVKNLLPSVGGLLAKAGGVAAKGAAALAPIAGKLLAMAGPAAAVAGAGAAGYAVGKHVINPLLDKGAAALTGDKDETVGTAIYKGVDKVAGWFGGSDADKSAAADKKSEIDLVMKKIGDNKPVSAQLLEKVGKYDLTPAQRQTLSKATTVTTIAKQVETPREVQATQLEQNTNRSKEIDQKKAEGTIAAPSATIVNNTNVSQVTNQTKITPPVRNQDPTYNDRLRATFI